MARIRTIKPEFWESEKIGKLSVLARLNFVGLISLADDEGRGRGSVGFLRSRLHPYAPDVSSKGFLSALRELQSSGVVVLYESGGCSYYSVPGYGEHQKINRPSPSHLPIPPPIPYIEPSVSPHGALIESSVSPHDALTVGMEGKGMEGKGVQKNVHLAMNGQEFLKFWSAYPRRQAKIAALKAWKNLRPDEALLGKIMGALESQKQGSEWKKDGGKYVPLPATWINGRRWEDEIDAITTNSDRWATPR